MSNSSLVTKSIPAHTGNYTTNRSLYSKIKEITIHHAAGNISVENIGAMWQTAGKNVSSHYGVCLGNIGQYVSESDIAWCNGNWDANCRAVTIEVANNGGEPNWPVADGTLETLIKLVADVAKRNDLHPLVLGKTLTWHSMYKATACPGPYLMGKMQYIVDEANKLNAESDGDPDGDLYGVMRQIIALTGKEKAQAHADKLNSEDKTAFYKIMKI